MKNAIELLKAKAEANGESLKSSDENEDGSQKDCVGKDEDDTGLVNKTSVKVLNGSSEGSDMDEHKCNAKRKKADSTEKLPEMGGGKATKRGRKAKKTVGEGNDSPSNPLYLPSNHE